MDDIIDNSELLPWEPGADIASEEEYQTATTWLATKLLRDCTPEQLAVVAAQHMIYADTLKQSNEAATQCNQVLNELDRAKSDKVIRLELERGYLINSSVKIVQTAMTEYGSHLGKKASDASKEEGKKQKVKALAEWDAVGDTFSGKTKFARIRCKHYQVTERTLCGWIAEHIKAKG